MTRVQSVTWAAVVGCPCGRLLSCSPSDPVSRAGSPSPLIPLPSRERGIPPHRRPVDSRLRGNDGPGCVVIVVLSWPSHGFVVLSDSVQSMKWVCVHRREYGACWFFVFIQLPLFPPRAPGFAARGTSRRRKFRKASNPPSGINASIRPSQRPLPRRTRPL